MLDNNSSAATHLCKQLWQRHGCIDLKRDDGLHELVGKVFERLCEQLSRGGRLPGNCTEIAHVTVGQLSTELKPARELTCSSKCSLHLRPAHLLNESIDVSNKVLADGTAGSLSVSSRCSRRCSLRLGGVGALGLILLTPP